MFEHTRSAAFAIALTGPDGGISLLLGVIYVGDPKVLQPAMSVLQGAKRVVVEGDPEAGDGTLAGFVKQADPGAVEALHRTGKLGRARWTAHLTGEDMALLRQWAACQAREAGTALAPPASRSSPSKARRRHGASKNGSLRPWTTGRSWPPCASRSAPAAGRRSTTPSGRSTRPTSTR